MDLKDTELWRIAGQIADELIADLERELRESKQTLSPAVLETTRSRWTAKIYGEITRSFE